MKRWISATPDNENPLDVLYVFWFLSLMELRLLSHDLLYPDIVQAKPYTNYRVKAGEHDVGSIDRSGYDEMTYVWNWQVLIYYRAQLRGHWQTNFFLKKGQSPTREEAMASFRQAFDARPAECRDTSQWAV